MGKVHDRIVELEATLTNHADEYEGYDLANMEEELFRLRHIEDLHDRLNKIPLDPDNDNITEPFNGFPAGTWIGDIQQWFLDMFSISLKNDF